MLKFENVSAQKSGNSKIKLSTTTIIQRWYSALSYHLILHAVRDLCLKMCQAMVSVGIFVKVHPEFCVF